ncbi:MAG: hypothetical protein ABR970_07160 [Roseiarcus sp.]
MAIGVRGWRSWLALPVQAPQSALAAVALVAVALGHGSSEPIGAAVALCGAVLCVCILPGAFVVRLFDPERSRCLPEQWMFAVGFSLCVVNCACVVGLTLHVPLHEMSLVMMAVLAAAALSSARWRLRPDVEPRPARESSSLRWIAVSVWLACLPIAYAVGNNYEPPGNENLLNIGIADAVRTALRPHEAFYISGVGPIYPFPSLNYLYALVADISGTTTVFTFEKLRFLWTATALATVFVGIRALVGSVAYAYLGLLGASLLALTGPFGWVPGFFWGQLATTSHPVDVEMNVIVPIGLASLFLLLSSRDEGYWYPASLFGGMGLLLSAIHQRELIQLLLYGACGLVVLLGRRASWALFLAMLASIFGALLYRAWAIAHAPGVGELIASTRASLLNELWQLNARTAFQPFTAGVDLDFSFLWGLNGLMLLATGFAFIRWRESPAMRACGLAVAAFLAIESFAVLAIPVLWATYDELLYTPVRHVIFVMYCCSSISFSWLLGVLERWRAVEGRRFRLIAMAIVAGAAVVGAARLLHDRVIPTELLAVVTAGCGLLSFLPFTRIAHERYPAEFSGPLAPVLAGLTAVAVFSAMPQSALVARISDGTAAVNPRAVMKREYRNLLRLQPGAAEGRCRAATAKLMGYTFEIQSCAPSFAIVDWLASHVSPAGVLMVDPLSDFASTGLVPARVAIPGALNNYRNWEQAFPRIEQAVRRSLETFGGMPFYAAGETAEERYADARSLGATLVLADPNARTRALAAASARPDLFDVRMDREQWLLLGVKP